MAKREDGRETRKRLLKAACEVFARKGFRNARIADICQSAGTNVASVNYHFGDKANLYAEAWRHALENLEELSVEDTDCDSPEDSLRHYIRELLQHFSAKGATAHFSRLYLMELVQPTGLIQDAWKEMIEPRRRKLHRIIRAVMGSGGDEHSVLFCELSIINQCRSMVTIQEKDLQYMLGEPLSPRLIDLLARHIADFSLAGIQAVARGRPKK